MQINSLGYLEKTSNNGQEREFAQEHLMMLKLLLCQLAASEIDWYIRTMLKHKLTTHLKRFGSNIQKLAIS